MWDNIEDLKFLAEVYVSRALPCKSTPKCSNKRVDRRAYGKALSLLLYLDMVVMVLKIMIAKEIPAMFPNPNSILSKKQQFETQITLWLMEADTIL